MLDNVKRYTVTDAKTGRRFIVFGRSLQDAMKGARIVGAKLRARSDAKQIERTLPDDAPMTRAACGHALSTGAKDAPVLNSGHKAATDFLSAHEWAKQLDILRGIKLSSTKSGKVRVKQ